MIGKMLGSKELVHKALDAAVMRNNVISQNIANVDTPGYKRKEVLFEQYLSDAIKKNKENAKNTPINVVEDKSNLSYRVDGNNVDIDTEMAELAKNNIKYNALIGMAGYSSIKTVLKS